MRPKRYDLVDEIDVDDPSASVLRGIRAGADWSLGLVLKTDPSTVEDLSGKAFAFQMRRSATDATILLSGSTIDGRVTSGGVTGQLVVFFARAVTSGLVPAQNVWGLYEVTAGAWTPRVEGLIDVTRAIVR